MPDYSKIAQKLSNLYPPLILPENKNEWNIGHQCLDEFERLHPRNELLIPTLAWTAFWLDTIKQASGKKPGTSLQYLMDWNIAVSYPEEFSSLKEKLLFLKYYFTEQKEKLSHRFFHSLKDIVEQVDRDIIKLRKIGMGSSHLIEKYHIANCGELASYATRWMQKQNHSSVNVSLELTTPDGYFHKTNDHVFLLFRTDNKPLNFQTAMEDLYHPNMRALDLWYGRCLPPQEMFHEYANFMLDLRPSSKPGLIRIQFLPKGMNFVLAPNSYGKSSKYLVGKIAGDIRVFGKTHQNTFEHIKPELYKSPKSLNNAANNAALIKNKHDKSL